MLEALIAIATFLVIAGIALAFHLSAWAPLLQAGGVLVAGGLLFGLPGAALYHVLLSRTLRCRGALPRGWIWSPTRLHSELTAEERPRVLFWFYWGAAGWVLAMLGCLVFVLGGLVARSSVG